MLMWCPPHDGQFDVAVVYGGFVQACAWIVMVDSDDPFEPYWHAPALDAEENLDLLGGVPQNSCCPRQQGHFAVLAERCSPVGGGVAAGGEDFLPAAREVVEEVALGAVHGGYAAGVADEVRAARATVNPGR